jgi:hypothetical protein
MPSILPPYYEDTVWNSKGYYTKQKHTPILMINFLTSEYKQIIFSCHFSIHINLKEDQQLVYLWGRWRNRKIP